MIYGDTDSCMVELPAGGLEETIANARVIEKDLNESYGEFATAGTAMPIRISSRSNSKRSTAVSSRQVRKNGMPATSPGKKGKIVDEIDIVGFEIRRSDYPQITKVVQMKVMEMILHGESFEVIRTYLGTLSRTTGVAVTPSTRSGSPAGLESSLADYETDDAHIRGAKYANEHLGMEFSKGSKPKRVYIKGVKSKYPRTDVLCFEYGDQVPPEFTDRLRDDA